MKLTQIDLRNFRLLSDSSIRINQNGLNTILVGPNNSGKTSLAEALLLFSGKSKSKFSVYDFSVQTWERFAKAEEHFVEAKDDVVAAQHLPTISMDLLFEYKDDGADLAVAAPLLMDLSEGTNVVRLRVSYAVSNPLDLAKDFRSWRQDGSRLFDFLLERLDTYFEFSYDKVAADGIETERLKDGADFHRLLAIDFVFAQRHLDDQEDSRSTRLSHLLYSQYEKHHKGEEPEQHEEIEAALRAHAIDLGEKYMSAFGGLITGLRRFGYPQGRAPSMSIKAELSSRTIFKDNTRIFYGAYGAIAAPVPLESEDGKGQVTAQGPEALVPFDDSAPAPQVELPEKYNGLGYKNLIYMVLQIQSFRTRLEKLPKDRPRVHLIFIEEPETHLHPQAQSTFIKEISNFLTTGDKGDDVQVVVTTHSSHIVADSGFEPIRYFRTKNAGVIVKDLMDFSDTLKGTDALRFLSKYMSLMRCDLFFARKAILIEGQVERLLLPSMIVQCAAAGRPMFASEYIIVMEVGGAYAHMFEGLIKFLEIPTLIVTDLNSVDANGEKCPVANGVRTSNATLKSWLPKKTNLADLRKATPEERSDGIVRVTYQCEESAGTPCARSFEEAFIYKNAAWLFANRAGMTATSQKFNVAAVADLVAQAYSINMPKVDFALDLLLLPGWETPSYIREGLEWLADCESAQ